MSGTIMALRKKEALKEVVMKSRRLGVTLAVVVVAFLVQGCASSTPLTRKDFPSSEPIKVCRYETPGIMKSTSVENALLGLAAIGAPGGSALLVLGDQYARARGLSTQAVIPDFGSLMMDKFLARMRADHPDWPPLIAIQEPLKEEFSEKCTVIELNVNRVAYGSLDLTRGGIIFERGVDKGFVSTGFLSKATITVKDAQGEVLGQKSYLYLSENYDRAMSLDELEANDFALLKEEIDFGAETTATEFVKYLTEGAAETAQIRE
jgi:hypothetical protein